MRLISGGLGCGYDWFDELPYPIGAVLGVFMECGGGVWVGYGEGVDACVKLMLVVLSAILDLRENTRGRVPAEVDEGVDRTLGGNCAESECPWRSIGVGSEIADNSEAAWGRDAARGGTTSGGGVTLETRDDEEESPREVEEWLLW